MINPKFDKDDCLMFNDCSIEKEQIIGKDTKLFYNLVDSSREPKEQQQFQEKKMQVYHLSDRLDMDIEELRLLMVKMSQRIHKKRMNIFISISNSQNNGRRQMTEEDCRSKASGALQQNILKPGELKMTKTKQHDEKDDQI